MVGVAVGVSDGMGVRLSVGVGGISVSVGTMMAVGGASVGVLLGVRVGSGVGVGRFRSSRMRSSA